MSLNARDKAILGVAVEQARLAKERTQAETWLAAGFILVFGIVFAAVTHRPNRPGVWAAMFILRGLIEWGLWYRKAHRS